MASIFTLEDEIREFINSARKQHALMRDPATWEKLCSCLDAIGDTELAFAAYESMPKAGDDGAAYIQVYGFLQALFVQQDAVRHLCQALGIPYSPDPLLSEIREIRNDAIGHPTNRGSGKRRTFNFISRPTLSKWGFQLMTVTPGKWPPQFRHVDLRGLYNTQRETLGQTLTTVLESLRREEMEHRDQFKGKKLAAVFPATLGYYFEKLYEAVRGAKGGEFGKVHLDLLTRVVADLRCALEERGALGVYDSIEYHVGLIEYPLEQLAIYFEGVGAGRLNDKDAFIFISFVESEFDSLRSIAGEIDEEYESPV